MSPVPVDRGRAVAAYRASAARFTGLLRRAGDPSPPAVGFWTVGDVACHVVHSTGFLSDCAHGVDSTVPDVTGITPHFQQLLDADPDRDLASCAERIDGNVARFLEAADRPDAETGRWHGGLDLPVSVLAILGVGETLLHGLDVARGAGREWEVGPEDAALVIDGYTHLLPHFVDRERARGFRATYGVRIRGGARFTATFDDGSLTIEPGGGPADCRLSAHPVDYLLVGFGRAPKLQAILKGRLLAYGRKPWLGPKMTSLFFNP